MSSVGSAGWMWVRSLPGVCFQGTGPRRGGTPGPEHLATSLSYAGVYPWRTVYWLRKAGKEYPAGTVDEDNMVPTANGSASNGERQKWTQ